MVSVHLSFFALMTPYHTCSLKKDVKKRGDLKTLLVSWSTLLNYPLQCLHMAIGLGIYDVSFLQTQSHVFVGGNPDAPNNQKLLSSSEFAGWVQRSVQANSILEKQEAR